MLTVKNRFFGIIGFVLLLGLVATDIFGQSNPRPRIRELSEAISSGDVTLTANGNGSSTGSAVTGRIKNNTPNEVRINVVINSGLYLSNSGRGQNMLAIQIFRSDGVYNENSTNRYIRLPQNTETQIVFYAFCADFERDDPSSKESFSIGPMPQNIQSIASKMSRYMNDNFDSNQIKAVQLALWRSQGLTRTAIANKFDFEDADWEIASRIMGY